MKCCARETFPLAVHVVHMPEPEFVGLFIPQKQLPVHPEVGALHGLSRSPHPDGAENDGRGRHRTAGLTAVSRQKVETNLSQMVELLSHLIRGRFSLQNIELP